MPTTPHQQPQLLSVSGSRNGNGPPPPIDNATCVSIFVGSLKDAREKTRELLSKGGTPTGENAILKPGVTLDLSHKKIANIPFEVLELIKDEIERSVQVHSYRPFFPFPRFRLPFLRLHLLCNPKKLLHMACSGEWGI